MLRKTIGAFRASMSSGDVSLLAQQELGLYAQRWAGAGPSGHRHPVAVGAAVKGVSPPGSRVPIGRDDPAQIDPSCDVIPRSQARLATA